MKRTIRGLCALVLATMAVGLLQMRRGQDSPTRDQAVTLSIGNVQTLRTAYDRWKTGMNRNEGSRKLVLPLGYSRGLSSEFTKARGQVILDLLDGTIAVEVTGLLPTTPHVVWLVHDRPGPGRSPGPDATDDLFCVGPLRQQGGVAALRTTLRAEILGGFKLDRVVVTREGDSPEEGGLLFGSPSLFQRLYYSNRRGQSERFALVSDPRRIVPAERTPWSVGFSGLLSPLAHAREAEGPVELDTLISEGERIFFNETFDGNGRTCGTCHPAAHNLTIDPAFIATLPPDDPLFVAEFNPDLAQLENPVLMRQFGLILENLDGFENPTENYVMRSVPHLLALSTSIASDASTPPLDRTGWSGDGAPGLGTLREFTIGGVRQHLTRTLNRVPGLDFRLPSEIELDAVEAFLLSLGRQEDPDLEALQLTDEKAERGRVLFITVDSDNGTVPAAKCNLCHRNAGALSMLTAGVNRNFNTGVEDRPHPSRSTGQPEPRDGGFGAEFDPSTGAYGDGSFNPPPLVEAADTAPFFHNNLAARLKKAVEFYDTDAFKRSPAGQLLRSMDSAHKDLDVEADALVAFLRVINTLENIRSATSVQERALQASTLAGAARLFEVALGEIEDCQRVLTSGRLHAPAVSHLQRAHELTESAAQNESAAERNALLAEAIAEEETARAQMVR